MAAMQIGGVAVVFVSGRYYLCETLDIDIDGLVVAGIVESGIEPSAAGGI